MSNILVETEKFLIKHKFLIVLLFLTFLARLPSLFEPLWYGDEAIYLTIGQKILRGSVMYADIFDHKTPGIYYLTSLAIGIFGPTVWSIKFLLTIWVLATVTTLYFLGRRLFNERVALIASVVFSILTSLTIIEGNIFNSEILMILPIMLGIFVGFRQKYFLAGIFFSLAVLLKVPAIFDFWAFFIFVALMLQKNTISLTFKNLFILVAGLSVPILVTIIYFLSTGTLGDYFQSAFLYNVSYTSYGNQFLIENGLLLVKAVPIILVIIYFFVRIRNQLQSQGDKRVNNHEFLIIWLVLSFYGAVFTGRAYEHYLIQPLPVFSLIVAASIFDRKFTRVGLVSILAVLILTFILHFRPWFNQTYYTNFVRFATNQITFDQYTASFDPVAPRNYALASFLTGCEKYDSDNECVKTRTDTKDKLYIFANHPAIYFLSGLDPASRFVTFFHIDGNELWKEETIRELADSKPKYILVEVGKNRDFLLLEKLLFSRYNLFAYYENMAVYKINKATSR
ncbi:glycosyltransferase family 39 protein [Patescibacteria group bacterium]|nr:glycosyltransferase family 39 protein [Patescibacteria group bacterium]